MSVQVSTSIDEATKLQFDKVCDSIGVSPSGALTIFIKGVIACNDIPFNAGPPPSMPRKKSREEVFGCMRGKIKMADDFDAPLDDFREYME